MVVHIDSRSYHSVINSRVQACNYVASVCSVNRDTVLYTFRTEVADDNTLLPGYNAGLRGRDLTRVIRQPRYNRQLQLLSNSVIL
jgi:hypothetical protein